jgi:diguanylate cyclase
MVSELFINTLLLISFTFIGEHLLKELPQNIMKDVKERILLGIAGGILGIFMMIYTINIFETQTFIDLRILTIIIVNIVGGITSAIISGVIILFFRINYFGLNQSSLVAIIQVILCLICFYILNKRIREFNKRWFAALGMSWVILILTYGYLLNEVEKKYLIISEFSIAFLLAGTLEYFLLKYALKSNELYRIYKKNSTQDFLTGLNNTRNFDKLVNETFVQAKENKFNLSCLMVDIDHFKRVNDTYGHPVGDIVLRELADILKNSCRSFDIIGRVGGEEFCILLLDCGQEEAFQIASRIRKAVKIYDFEIGNKEYINITVSIGVSTYPDKVIDLDKLKEMADRALYTAKRTGRDKICNDDRCIFEV